MWALISKSPQHYLAILERQNSLGTCLCLNVCLLTNFIDVNEPPNSSRLDRPLTIVLLHTIKIFCHASSGLKESQHYLNKSWNDKTALERAFVHVCAYWQTLLLVNEPPNWSRLDHPPTTVFLRPLCWTRGCCCAEEAVISSIHNRNTQSCS